MAGTDTDPAGGGLLGAEAVVAFWRAAGPKLWFVADPAFDARVRERLGATSAAAAHGGLQAWRGGAVGSLALILLLDQVPRNLWRGSARAFDSDPQARELARASLAAGHDLATPPDLRLFFYLPFSHAEDLADQDAAVRLGEALERDGGPSANSARRRRAIIRRFGRFPHRNVILGRASTVEEDAFLATNRLAP